MMSMRQKVQSVGQRIAAIPLALALSLSAGCTWVQVTAEGDVVKLATAEESAACEKVGTTTGSVLNKILFVRRSRAKVGSELVAKARNEAAKMGGDTVVESGEEVDASQTFDVYRCDS